MNRFSVRCIRNHHPVALPSDDSPTTVTSSTLPASLWAGGVEPTSSMERHRLLRDTADMRFRLHATGEGLGGTDITMPSMTMWHQTTDPRHRTSSRWGLAGARVKVIVCGGQVSNGAIRTTGEDGKVFKSQVRKPGCEEITHRPWRAVLQIASRHSNNG